MDEDSPVTSEAEQLYSHAVAHPLWSVDSAADELGLTRDDVETAKTLLTELRLFQPSADGQSVVPVSPDIAVADRTHDDLERIRELKDDVARIRSTLASFEALYAAARQRRHETDRQIEVLETPAAVARLVNRAVSQCRERAYIMHPTVSFRAEMHRASAIYDEELVARGVDRRNLYHQGTTTNAATRRAVADLEPVGVQFRVLPVIPVHAIIYDDDLAIVSRRSTHDDRAALVIRDPDLVRVARHLFETVWEFAEPFPTSEPGVESSDRPSQAQTRILEGLAAGLTDEAVARRNGIHVRTVRRHLTVLSELAGADSRFQLALRARDLGWL